jgi:hypothetical protein
MSWQCTLLQRWLPEYPDGDLPAFWRGRLKAHLDRCPACRADLAEMREVEQAIQEMPAADPGPEFWTEFSREMHLKLVQADQAGQMAPAPRSVWWSRLPYLVGAPGLAALLIWVGVSYLQPGRPGLAPTAQRAYKEMPSKPAPAAMARKPRPAPSPALPPSDEDQNFIYASKHLGGDKSAKRGEDLGLEDDLDDLDETLAGMTPQEKEAFLKKLSGHKRDGSCIRSFSTVYWA